ncbi:DNA protecting protein DprA [Anaerobacillus arseniciselenatis]|uniref:DNA protecting protein DprA n=1 Tax=Anaerobacillus arseniciselenatis TaxID=85682 RepID=A0A1S2LBY9_9BACI|nr:DNA-processing protein DprA [Anaerobacillus arseniciselenatis]OIJ10018.1 DNA protecting protein DprA [Anaerobacillus arseniciselenatis]
MVINVRERLIRIHACRGVTWLTIKKFFEFDPTLKNVFVLSKDELREKFTLSNDQIVNIYHGLHCKSISANIAKYPQLGIHVVTIFDKTYPLLLKEIYDPPWVLYCKGNLSHLSFENKISVVGTRSPSRNGILSLNKVVTPLVESGWLIVSGLAVGIDAQAHMVALNNHRNTIAVLASGFNYIYPRCHQKLAHFISKEHLLISEYPPNQKPQKWNFPMRNRIISGLSKGTIVIEARKRSGSLITADLALQQGREVFAVPGSILDERTEGNHWLIQQGAKLTKCSNDVLNEL